MNSADRQPSCVVLGEQSLLIQCAELLLERGFRILTVVTADPRITAWCAQQQLTVTGALEELPDTLGQAEFDYLFSITNLRMLSRDLLRRARKMAINLHDGPLPRYAGLNAPVWALMAGETEHGVSWHVIEEGADTGAVLVNRKFAIEADDTVFSLNARCYENGLASFSDLLEALVAGNLIPQPQDLSRRSYFGLASRPANEAILDLSRPASQLIRCVSALDFGPYPNPVALPKLLLGKTLVLVRDAEQEPAVRGIQAGAVQAASSRSLTVGVGGGAIRFNRVTNSRGDPIDAAQASPIALTLREFDLLHFLARHPAQVFSRADLLQRVWGAGFDGFEHTVNSHINRLRAKLDAGQTGGTDSPLIETVWGMGYRFNPGPGRVRPG